MPTTPTPMDEWIAGESLNYKRHYVVHANTPRFIAEFLEIDRGSAALHQVVAGHAPLALRETLRLVAHPGAQEPDLGREAPQLAHRPFTSASSSSSLGRPSSACSDGSPSIPKAHDANTTIISKISASAWRKFARRWGRLHGAVRALRSTDDP